MGKANFDKIILLTCLLVASVLFYQNQQNYAKKLSAKQWEISKTKIAHLESKHFDLRNKFVQFNNADKYGLAISDLFLEGLKKTHDSENSEQALSNLKSIAKIQLFIAEKQGWQLKSADATLEYILNMFEEIVDKKTNPLPYKSEFIVLVENLEEYDNDVIFNITPFESFHLPKTHVTATLYGDTLKTTSIPSKFCLELTNVEFESKLGSKFLIDSKDEFSWP